MDAVGIDQLGKNLGIVGGAMSDEVRFHIFLICNLSWEGWGVPVEIDTNGL
jgi:hypothetical protein